MTESHDPGFNESFVKAVYLARMVGLGAGAVVLAVQDVHAVALAVLALLVVSTQLGLQSAWIRRLVARHPAWALPDLTLVVALLVAVPVTSPIIIVGAGSALLVGVLFPVRTVVPLTVLLVVPFSTDATAGVGADAFTMPAVIATLAALGAAIRRITLRRDHLAAEVARAQAAAAAADERLRLARDLHDRVASLVNGAALHAQALGHWIDRDPVAARRAATATAQAAADALTATRQVLTSMRELDDRPLAVSLTATAQAWSSRQGRAVTLDVDPATDVDPDDRCQVLLTVAEALENVARHAVDASVVLRSWIEDDLVVVVVADDGPGMSADRPVTAVAEGRYGLLGVRERVEAMGGRVDLVTVPDEGTTVRLVLPRTSTPQPALSTLPSTAAARSPVRLREAG